MSDNSTLHSGAPKPEEKGSEVVLATEKKKRSSQDKAHIKYSRIKRKVLKHVWLVRGLVFAAFISILVLFSLLLIRTYKDLKVGGFIDLVGNFITAPVDKIPSYEGRTNILVMGIGGEGHEGSTLTDTIMVVSVSLFDPSVVMVSVPRDIWIPDLRAKINSAYYWGNQKNPGGGMSLSKSVVEDLLGVKIQYAAVIDFSGFKRIIDVMGGIVVNVENGFTDPRYPIAGRENDLCGGDVLYGCRYETITFLDGDQYMDGETALKFVRSRHAEGDEGTDTARQARQQAVIEAIKEKALTPDIFLNPNKVREILKVLDESIETDVNSDSGAIILRKLYDSRNSVSSFLIPEDLLFNPPINSVYDRQYVFIPKAGNGDWSEINAWMKKVYSGNSN